MLFKWNWVRLLEEGLHTPVSCWVFTQFSSSACSLVVNSSEVAQSCLTLCDPMDCSSLPGSSAHGIFQAIVLEWIAISFSRGSSQPRDRTWVAHLVDRCFPVWATREVTCWLVNFKNSFLHSRAYLLHFPLPFLLQWGSESWMFALLRCCFLSHPLPGPLWGFDSELHLIRQLPSHQLWNPEGQEGFFPAASVCCCSEDVVTARDLQRQQ